MIGYERLRSCRQWSKLHAFTEGAFLPAKHKLRRLLKRSCRLTSSEHRHTRALLNHYLRGLSKVFSLLSFIFPLTLEALWLKKLPFHRGFKYAGSSAEPALIAVCCVCGLVRARKTFPSESDRWITCRAYEHRYGVALMSSTLTHTYCSGCYTDFMQRVRHTRQATAPLPH